LDVIFILILPLKLDPKIILQYKFATCTPAAHDRTSNSMSDSLSKLWCKFVKRNFVVPKQREYLEPYSLHQTVNSISECSVRHSFDALHVNLIDLNASLLKSIPENYKF